MGTKANPGQFDCYAAAADDEPLFVLRAKDPLAPALVHEWANRYEDATMRELGGVVHERKGLEKSDEARVCARAMRLWRKAQDEDKR